ELYLYDFTSPLYHHSFPTRRSSDLDVFLPAGVVGNRIDRDADQLDVALLELLLEASHRAELGGADRREILRVRDEDAPAVAEPRSEEHTSELQSRENLVCRLLLEKK